jgi:hypothetical protein
VLEQRRGAVRDDQALLGGATAEAGTLLGRRHCFSRFFPAVSGTGIEVV